MYSSRRCSGVTVQFQLWTLQWGWEVCYDVSLWSPASCSPWEVGSFWRSGTARRCGSRWLSRESLVGKNDSICEYVLRFHLVIGHQRLWHIVVDACLEPDANLQKVRWTSGCQFKLSWGGLSKTLCFFLLPHKAAGSLPFAGWTHHRSI